MKGDLFDRNEAGKRERKNESPRKDGRRKIRGKKNEEKSPKIARVRERMSGTSNLRELCFLIQTTRQRISISY